MTTADDDAREEIHDAAEPLPEVLALAAPVLERFPACIACDSHGQSVVYVPREDWHAVAAHLRDEERFTQCLDVCAVDHLVDESRAEVEGVTAERFEVVASFLSHPRNVRMRLIAEIPSTDPTIATITDLYPGIAFGERETFDLFGIVFEGNEDLTRILMPDDWVGYPLRKDDAPARIPVTFKNDPSPR